MNFASVIQNFRIQISKYFLFCKRNKFEISRGRTNLATHLSTMSSPPRPILKPDAAAAAVVDDAALASPEEGMKNLNALMADMLAEAERGAVGEKKVEARLLSLLRDMRAYREALAAKKQDYLARLSHIRRSLDTKGDAEVGSKSDAEHTQLGKGTK